MARHAEFIREIEPQESWDDLVRDAKALTYELFQEHAVLELADHRRILVRGGPYGIDLERTLENDPFGRGPNELLVGVQGKTERVARLVFHVHPKPTGPSDDDLMVLELLGQEESMLFELSASPEGTVIRPKHRR